MGGQQPVTGSQVTLYAAGSGGLGTGDSALATVTTDANGTFNFAAGSYSCPAGDPLVYAVASQGDSGSGNNPALALSAGLGHCSTLGGLNINIDEVTTVASVWALSQFLDSSGVHVGTTSSIAGSPGQTGLANAFLTITNLADLRTGQAVTALVAGASGTPPAATVNTLANILARCVNSNGSITATSPCGLLFTAATPAGGAAPTTTLAAAWAIARNPANNAAQLFQATSASDPFQTPQPLQAAPADWTLALTFSGDLFTSNSSAGLIAIDAAGNAWIISAGSDTTVNGGNGFVLPISPQGVQGAQGAPVTASGIYNPDALGFDALGQLWIANSNSTVNNAQGSVTGLAKDLTPLAGSPFTGTGTDAINLPTGIGIDLMGNIWTGNTGANTTGIATLSATSAYGVTITVPAGGPAGSARYLTTFGFDAAGNAWSGDTDNPLIVEFPNGDLATPVYFTGTYLPGVLGGLQVDASGNVWAFAPGQGKGVTKLTKGTSGYTGANYPDPSIGTTIATLDAMTLDGAGRPWLATEFATTPNTTYCVVALDANGNVLNGGCLAAAVQPVATAHQWGGIAIDPSGNVWITNGFGNQVFEIVGAAVPVTTPVIGYAKPL
jgi:sugar lactone lactonase YvrE